MVHTREKNASSSREDINIIASNPLPMKVKKIHTNNGMEFCSNEFESYCKSKGIVRHYTVPHTQQNGVVERMNRTIISKACCMLSNAGLNRRFWASMGVS
jgi:transposase InsO family protein